MRPPRGAANRLKDERIQRALALRRSGKTFREIADDLAMTRQRARQLLERAKTALGWPEETLRRTIACIHCAKQFSPAGTASRPEFCPSCRLQHVVESRRSGKTLRAIAADLKVTPQQAARLLDKARTTSSYLGDTFWDGIACAHCTKPFFPTSKASRPRICPNCRTQHVLTSRQSGKTLQAIAADLGMTRQRAHQILEKARIALNWSREALQRKTACNRCGKILSLGTASRKEFCSDCQAARTCAACGQETVRTAKRRLCESCRVVTRPCGACGKPITRDRGTCHRSFRYKAWYCDRKCFGRHMGRAFGAENLRKYRAEAGRGARRCAACRQEFEGGGIRRLCESCRVVTRPCGACGKPITRDRSIYASAFRSATWYCDQECFKRRARPADIFSGRKG
jgi:transcriptional regulator